MDARNHFPCIANSHPQSIFDEGDITAIIETLFQFPNDCDASITIGLPIPVYESGW